MQDIVYSNLRLDPDAHHFLFVGEFKSCCLNEFVARALRRVFGPRVRAVSIVPDVLGEYPGANVTVINPDALSAMRAEGRRVALRIPMSRFATHVCESSYVMDLVRQLLEHQGELSLWMFESRPELTLRQVQGVRFLGPRASLVAQFNDKTWQYQTLTGHVPVVDHRVCCGCEELWEAAEDLRSRCPDGVFVTNCYSAGGANSLVTTEASQVTARFADPAGRYLASGYVPHDHDPTVLGCVGGPGQVYVAGVADMRIENQTMFRGSTWPSQLPLDIQGELVAHTRMVGEILAERGFRGIFGCDYIVDRSGRVLFIEVNPRKQGTTMEYCCALEQLLPEGTPSLFDMEYEAVTRDRLPDGCVEPSPADAAAAGLFWGTYNLKVKREALTTTALAMDMPERELFQRVAAGGKGSHLILEHVGADVLVKPLTFLGRVAAVGRTRQEMLTELDEGEMRLRRSFVDFKTATREGNHA